jgi:hypothetical protein
MRRPTLVLALLVLLATAVRALAQGYEVVPTERRVEARPPDVTTVDVDSSQPAKATAVVALPFTFWHYGTPCETAVVSAHGWLLPGAKEGFADAGDPAAAHGQDAATGAFPYGAGPASASGIVAPYWTRLASVNDGSPGAGAVVTWTAGTAPRRRFVVSWQRVAAASDGRRLTFQAQLHETTGVVVFAYAADTVTGSDAPPPRFVCGLDSPADARFTAPLGPTAANTGLPPHDFVLTPRSALCNVPEAPKCGAWPVWLKDRQHALRGHAGAATASYLAMGTCWFFVRDRATQGDPARAQALVDEDRAKFGGDAGDLLRWVRQTLDGKAVLLPADGGAAVRLWFRVIEHVTIDDRGVAGRDDHVWNLRILLSTAFPSDDPRSRIEHYAAWRATASARLSVGKLFAATQTDDGGRQFDTGRTKESVSWCARVRGGPRGPMPHDDCPTAGWVRFAMRDRNGEPIEQHGDRRTLRWVPDPHYVDAGYTYVVRSDDDPTGWMSRVRPRMAGMTEEPFEFDPPEPAGAR